MTVGGCRDLGGNLFERTELSDDRPTVSTEPHEGRSKVTRIAYQGDPRMEIVELIPRDANSWNRGRNECSRFLRPGAVRSPSEAIDKYVLFCILFLRWELEGMWEVPHQN